MLLSAFLGIFGIDRIYLGYPFMGVLKFLTMGGFVIGNIFDMILIATQVAEIQTHANSSHFPKHLLAPSYTLTHIELIFDFRCLDQPMDLIMKLI
jgi:TM2 domain-containing membrane protein YozV